MATSDQNQSFLDATESAILTVVVGAAQKEFYVRWNLLAYHSSYFKGLTNPAFKEAKEKRVTLLDVEQTTFQRFLCWIEYGRLYEPKGTKRNPQSTNFKERTDVNLEINDLVSLWVFGDARGVPSLQNEAIRRLHQYLQETRSYVAEERTQLIYSNTTKTSKLREYLIDRAVYTIPWVAVKAAEDRTTSNSKRFPYEFLLDALAKFKINPSPDQNWKLGNLQRYFEEDPTNYKGHS